LFGGSISMLPSEHRGVDPASEEGAYEGCRRVLVVSPASRRRRSGRRTRQVQMLALHAIATQSRLCLSGRWRCCRRRGGSPECGCC
jgi:hypothetical protein